MIAQFDGYEPSTTATAKTAAGVGSSRFHGRYALAQGTRYRPQVRTHTVLDDTLPTGPHTRTIAYSTPFHNPTREHDYQTAWTAFTARLLGRPTA